jgi:4-amino-4-deoxy-L-arabinose transferase-like glycosyltransferase
MRGFVLGLVFVAALALARGVLVASFTPPFVAPDEPAHFDYVQRLAEYGRLPQFGALACDRFSAEGKALEAGATVSIAFRPDRPFPPLASLGLPDPSDPTSRATTGCGPAAHYAPVYYGSGALGYRAFENGSLLQRVFGARLASVAWGVLTAAFAYLAGWWWFGRSRDALLLGIVTVSQPVLGFFSSVVNNDAALFAGSAASFAAVAWSRRRKESRAPLLLLAAAAAVGVLSKPTLALFLPVLAACSVCALGPERRRSWRWTALALAPAALGAAAWSVFVRTAMRNMAGTSPRHLPWWNFLNDSVLHGERLHRIWVEQYWMTWGWLDTQLAEPYYRAIVLCLSLSFLGIVVGWRRFQPHERRLIVLTAACTTYALVVLYAIEREVLRRHGMPFVQGRYLLPLLPMHATVIVTGLRALSQKLTAALDAAWLFAAVLIVVDAAAIARTLVRYYS